MQTFKLLYIIPDFRLIAIKSLSSSINNHCIEEQFERAALRLLTKSDKCMSFNWWRKI